jgi:hypothetical protein
VPTRTTTLVQTGPDAIQGLSCALFGNGLPATQRLDGVATVCIRYRNRLHLARGGPVTPVPSGALGRGDAPLLGRTGPAAPLSADWVFTTARFGGPFRGCGH